MPYPSHLQNPNEANDSVLPAGRHCLSHTISFHFPHCKSRSSHSLNPAPYKSGYAGISSDFGSVKAASDRGSVEENKGQGWHGRSLEAKGEKVSIKILVSDEGGT